MTGSQSLTSDDSVHATDAPAAQAQSDLTTAYDDATGRPPDASSPADITGPTLTAGVYKSTSWLDLTGDVTVDGQGDPSAIFVFHVAPTLITASGSRVVLTGSAQGCNVSWQVGSSATLGTSSLFKASILASTPITPNTCATLDGRTLARNGAVTTPTPSPGSRARQAPPVAARPGGGTTGAGTLGHQVQHLEHAPALRDGSPPWTGAAVVAAVSLIPAGLLFQLPGARFKPSHRGGVGLARQPPGRPEWKEGAVMIEGWSLVRA